MNSTFLSLIQWDHPPNWTEVWGFIVSCLSLAAAGIAAWKLLKRDKQRENEVDALIKLAKHNEAMWKLEVEKTKPRIHLEETNGNNVDDVKIRLRNDGAKGTIVLFRPRRDIWFADVPKENVVIDTNQVYECTVRYGGKKSGPHELFNMLVRDSVGVQYIQKCTILFRLDESYTLWLSERFEGDNIVELMEKEWFV